MHEKCNMHFVSKSRCSKNRDASQNNVRSGIDHLNLRMSSAVLLQV